MAVGVGFRGFRCGGASDFAGSSYCSNELVAICMVSEPSVQRMMREFDCNLRRLRGERLQRTVVLEVCEGEKEVLGAALV